MVTARPLLRQRMALALVCAALAAFTLPGAAAQAEPPPRVLEHPALQPIDAQDWVDQANLTWDDYTAIRPEEWHDTSVEGSQKQMRGAVLLVDFTDQPFLITREPETHPFGNPQPGHEPVAPEDVAQWYYDYLNTPGPYNGGQSVHSYWMEDSHGRFGVELTPFGPYTLPGKVHEYGLNTGPNPNRNVSSSPTATSSVCPAGDNCNKPFHAHSQAAWSAGEGRPLAELQAEYDFIFYVASGHDESATWQEFGEMLFDSREDVPPELGPPGAVDGPVYNAAGVEIPNWAPTRYVPWTSWRAAANVWPASVGLTGSHQAEGSGLGMYAHEFSHVLDGNRLPDNYNNPYADNIRNYSGYWEVMSRGTFNGPGGTHNRWQVPNVGGSGLAPHHMLRNKLQAGFLTEDEVLRLERNTLHEQGIAVARVQQRSALPGQGGVLGINLAFGAGGNQRTCAALGFTGPNSFWCHGNNSYNNYTVEVVDRVGNDSFVPGHGVLIALTRNSATTPNVWLIDPNPDDIGMVDYYRPDGTPVAVLRGDPRQLNDATFHAGTDSGSAFEFVDDLNNLHFYVLEVHRTADGLLLYDIGIRRLTGAGPFARGVDLGAPTKTPQSQGFLATCTFPLTNTGEAGEGVFGSDIYRLSAAASSEHWEVRLPNALAHASAGESTEVEVHALRLGVEDGDARTAVTLTATSEADPEQSATATCNVHVRDTTPGGLPADR